MSDYNAVLYKLLGEKIRNYRTEFGLSQGELAEKVSFLGAPTFSISRASISNMEMGRHQPPLHVLSYLSKALRTDIHGLLPSNGDVLDYLENEVLNQETTSDNGDLLSLLQKHNLDFKTERKLEKIIKNL